MKIMKTKLKRILFCFIHRVTTGRTVEETFFTEPEPIPDYEI